MTTDTTYNGYLNRATWNVALWIGNEAGLYNAAVSFMSLYDAANGGKGVKGAYKGRAPYAAFIRHMGMQDERTGDNFKWLSDRLCYRELNDFMKELVC